MAAAGWHGSERRWFLVAWLPRRRWWWPGRLGGGWFQDPALPAAQSPIQLCGALLGHLRRRVRLGEIRPDRLTAGAVGAPQRADPLEQPRLGWVSVQPRSLSGWWRLQPGPMLASTVRPLRLCSRVWSRSERRTGRVHPGPTQFRSRMRTCSASGPRANRASGSAASSRRSRSRSAQAAAISASTPAHAARRGSGSVLAVSASRSSRAAAAAASSAGSPLPARVAVPVLGSRYKATPRACTARS